MGYGVGQRADMGAMHGRPGSITGPQLMIPAPPPEVRTVPEALLCQRDSEWQRLKSQAECEGLAMTAFQLLTASIGEYTFAPPTIRG